MRCPVADIEVEVDCFGESGPAIVLVHGLGGSRRTWSELAPLLASEARVVVPDLRGCGGTSRGTSPWTLAQAADDIAGVAAALGLGRYVLVGHSLGGVIAQELLTRHRPEIAGAVLISTSSRLSAKATENWLRLADTVLQRGISDSPASQARGFAEAYASEHPEVLAEHARIAAATDQAVYSEQARAASSYDFTSALASVTCPVLILQGLADRLTPPGGSVLLQRAMPAHSRLEMIEGAGHNLPIEMPATVARLVLEFAREATEA